ncbi:transcriptional regulator [Vibrio sp. UCD-FRSSP16_10]|uniref:nuclear transport factor 2 family protein n=1 Tax=unclassified Vibrio TaxID=2614977 RepID=UPI0007FCEE4C|nr:MULTISPECIES: nuclear transport factor 2 family protein [unclassified Vibrio]OBT15933.1 transcriptional regulator [Vibrio sp. UCD-FRSSP16_10]OBT17827.1 transcriptional regulator [Vibrio sp. UCD-FRSSP16_30]
MNVDTVADVYQRLNKNTLDSLKQIYHPDVVFEDAAHQLNGWQALSDYFEQLYRNVAACRFDIQSTHQAGEVGFIIWIMRLRHPKLKGGKEVAVRGISHIEFFEGKIIHHRDYFDMGEMLYEQLPVLGSLIKAIKKRLGQS